MDQFLTYTVLGLTTAAIYAVAASGLVVTYTTSGIFNFAHGAVGMIAAFAFWQLTVAWGVPTVPALILVGGVAAPLFGALVERVVFRGIEGASEVTKLVVSVSLLATLVALATWIWPPAGRPVEAFFPGAKFKLGPVFVTWAQVTTVLIAVAVAVGLRLLLHRTRIGFAMRGVVDDRDLLVLNGGSPARAAMLSWAIGTALGALAGILMAPVLQLAVVPLTLLVVNAYAAAVIGRLKSLPMTFVGAVILGLAEAYGTAYLPTGNALLRGIRPAIPIIVLFVALLLLPQARLRGHGVVRSREFIPAPSLRTAAIGGVVLVAAAWLVGGMLSSGNALSLGRGLGLAIVGLSLVPLIGYAGQISLCQLSFAGIGAVAMGHFGAGGSPMGLVWAFLLAAAVGALVALPALRLQGIYLALATAAFAVVLDRWIFQLRGVTAFGQDIEIFGGGTLAVPRLQLGPVSFASDQAQLTLLAAVFALFAVLVVAIRRGRMGRRLLALRDSPAACATFGIDLTVTKLGVFALSAGMAGVGGALFGGLVQSVTTDTFNFVVGLPVLMMTVVGGIGAVTGALFGGVALGGIEVVAGAAPWLRTLLALTPGLVGIGLGRNPNGVVSDIAAGVEGARERIRTGRAHLVVRGAHAAPPPAPPGGPTHRIAELDRAVPLGLVGVDRPFTTDDRDLLDALLGLNEADLDAAARR